MQYMTDERGNKTAVVLPLKEYQEMIEALEELDDIREFDRLQDTEEFVPWEEVKKNIGPQD